MNFKNKLLFMTFLFINFVIGDIPSYSAKYTFESDEISISGVRSFKSDLNGSEIKFEASNLLANLFFSSKFKIINGEVVPKTYDIKIKTENLIVNLCSLKDTIISKEEVNIVHKRNSGVSLICIYEPDKKFFN